MGVEETGNDLVNGVEGRPNALAFIEAVPPGCRKRTQILATQLRLTLTQFGDQVVTLRLGCLVTAGGFLCQGGKIVAHEMAAQFTRALAILRLLPASQRLSGTGRQASIDSERVEQPSRRESRQLATIPCPR